MKHPFAQRLKAFVIWSIQLTDSSYHRLFVAIWPTPQIRTLLSNLQNDFQLNRYGRCIPSRNFHITVVFLGDVAAEEVDPVIEIVRAIEFKPFSIELDQVGSWPRNKVAWVGSSSAEPELTTLLENVRRNLKSKKERRKFIPHVTLARKFRRKIHYSIEPILWPVHKIALVRSNLSSLGAHYEIVAESKLP